MEAIKSQIQNPKSQIDLKQGGFNGLPDFGGTDFNVSRPCLGTMTMGWTSDKKDSFAVMDLALDQGINFFDTADAYSRWAKGNPGGVAETWIGEWLKERKSRPKVIIATKAQS